jgi:hypothetical protein
MTGRRWPKPPPDVVEAGLRALVEALSETYPHLEFIPHAEGKRLPAGARRLPAALPLQVEPERDVGEP